MAKRTSKIQEAKKTNLSKEQNSSSRTNFGKGSLLSIFGDPFGELPNVFFAWHVKSIT